MVSISGNQATLPIYIHSHTIRKVDDADSIFSMSASVLDDEKTNPFPIKLSSAATSLSDVEGYYRAEPYSRSSTPSHSPSPGHPPGLPHTSPTIDSDVHGRTVGIPKPVLDIASAPRHATDTPTGVHNNRDDMV